MLRTSIGFAVVAATLTATGCGAPGILAPGDSQAPASPPFSAPPTPTPSPSPSPSSLAVEVPPTSPPVTAPAPTATPTEPEPIPSEQEETSPVWETTSGSMQIVLPDGWESGILWDGASIGGDSEGWTTGAIFHPAGDGILIGLHYGETLYNGEYGEPIEPCEIDKAYTILDSEPVRSTMDDSERLITRERAAARPYGEELANHYLITQIVESPGMVEAEIFLSSMMGATQPGCGAHESAATPDRQVSLTVGVTDSDYRLSGSKQFETVEAAQQWLASEEVELFKDVIRSVEFNVASK